MSARGADSPLQVRARAVVWTPPAGKGRAAPLLDNLSRRGVEQTIVESDLWAMAYACLHGAGTLLVLSEPGTLRGAAQVALALRKYSPAVVVYAYEPGSTKLLREVTDQDLVDWGAPGRAPEPARHAPPPAQGRPMLRLRDDGGARPIGPSLPITEHVAGPSDGPPQAADVLSAEELAMLLGRNGSKGIDGGGNAKGDQR